MNVKQLTSKLLQYDWDTEVIIEMDLEDAQTKRITFVEGDISLIDEIKIDDDKIKVLIVSDLTTFNKEKE
jgi:hypothetical protein